MSGLLLQPSGFQKTKISGLVEDDVVQQPDAYDFTGVFELGGGGEGVLPL